MRPVIASLLALAVGAALAGCDRQKAPAPQGEAPGANAEAGDGNAAAAARAYPTGRLDRSHGGTPAPDVAFEDPQGRPVRLSDFRGRPLLLNLWATWCGPCVVEMPSLDALAAREDGDVRVLALSQDLAGRQKVTDFFAARNFARLEPFLDPDLRVMTSLGIDTLPTTILYDAEGVEVWRMTGMADWESERAARLLREAEAGG
ncbi:MAG: TlpA family protein disulfide reductase [Allosphingosinicella sp.]